MKGLLIGKQMPFSELKNITKVIVFQSPYIVSTPPTIHGIFKWGLEVGFEKFKMTWQFVLRGGGSICDMKIGCFEMVIADLRHTHGSKQAIE